MQMRISVLLPLATMNHAFTVRCVLAPWDFLLFARKVKDSLYPLSLPARVRTSKVAYCTLQLDREILESASLGFKR